jgi:hypothetical protein
MQLVYYCKTPFTATTTIYMLMIFKTITCNSYFGGVILHHIKKFPLSYHISVHVKGQDGHVLLRAALLAQDLAIHITRPSMELLFHSKDNARTQW